LQNPVLRRFYERANGLTIKERSQEKVYQTLVLNCACNG